MDPKMLSSVALGLGFGLFNGGIGTWTVLWSLKKSDRVFYGTWVTGILYRFAFLLVFAFFLYTKTDFNLAYALVALTFGQILWFPVEFLWILKRF